MIALPETPWPSSISWTPVDFGGNQQGPLGGAAQRINRNGNRWSMTNQMPIMRVDDAREWIAKLTMALRAGASIRVRQIDFDIGAPGTPTVDGAGQAGATLSIKGGTPYYAYRFQQMINVETGDRRPLYMVVAPAIADANGDVTLQIEPPLRVEPSDGDSVNVGSPVIEGDIAPGGVPWTIELVHTVGLSFAISEAI